jgi:hypothetical protein
LLDKSSNTSRGQLQAKNPGPNTQECNSVLA